MVIGSCIGIVGTVLLTRIGLGTPTALWATYLVITGFGLGMGVQVPFTALQVVLRLIFNTHSSSGRANFVPSENHVPTGNGKLEYVECEPVLITSLSNHSVLFAAWSVSFQSNYTQPIDSNIFRSAAIAIGQSLLINGLLREIPRLTDAIDPRIVVHAGPLNLKALAKSPAVLHALRSAYSLAVRDTIYFSLAAVCVTIPFAFGMQWLNVKKAARNKDAEEAELVRLA